MTDRILKVALVQCSLLSDPKTNRLKLESFCIQSKEQGADLIVLPELFDGPYFCKTENESFFSLAHPLQDHPSNKYFCDLSKKLCANISISLFEKDGTSFYNTLLLADARGSHFQPYRKTHIPDGPGYEEKYYFKPGPLAPPVWDTGKAKIGAAICWDQWYPELARLLALGGAELIIYPTAIGSEPENPQLDTRRMWQRVMRGHAVANQIPIVAANRVGCEAGQTFYGNSFICDHQGEFLVKFGDKEEGILIHDVNLDLASGQRALFGFFKDRRSDLYGPLAD